MPFLSRDIFRRRSIQIPASVDPEISDQARREHIAGFWDGNLNGEIFLRDRPDLTAEGGSKAYFDEIRRQRHDVYCYWLEDLYAFLGPGEGKAYLDVGCGMGFDPLEVHRRGYRVTGVDLSPKSIEMAERLFRVEAPQALASGEARLRVADAEALPFADESFDAVSSGVLQHTMHPEKGIAELHRVLRPGGKAWVFFYHRRSINYAAHWLLNKGFENVTDIDRPTIAHHVTRSEFRAMLAAFDIERLDTAYAYGAGWGPVFALTPSWLYRRLSRWWGWFLIAYCRKR